MGHAVEAPSSALASPAIEPEAGQDSIQLRTPLAGVRSTPAQPGLSIWLTNPQPEPQAGLATMPIR